MNFDDEKNMFTKSEDLNFELFNLDSDKRQSSYFKQFSFNTEELDRMREYLLDYIARYPFLKPVDELLLATYQAKILIEKGEVERGKTKFTIAYNNFKELPKLSEAKEAKFRDLADKYCSESINNSMSSVKKSHP